MENISLRTLFPAAGLQWAVSFFQTMWLVSWLPPLPTSPLTFVNRPFSGVTSPHCLKSAFCPVLAVGVLLSFADFGERSVEAGIKRIWEG